jgi:hypothetical protein
MKRKLFQTATTYQEAMNTPASAIVNPEQVLQYWTENPNNSSISTLKQDFRTHHRSVLPGGPSIACKPIHREYSHSVESSQVGFLLKSPALTGAQKSWVNRYFVLKDDFLYASEPRNY